MCSSLLTSFNIFATRYGRHVGRLLCNRHRFCLRNKRHTANYETATVVYSDKLESFRRRLIHPKHMLPFCGNRLGLSQTSSWFKEATDTQLSSREMELNESSKDLSENNSETECVAVDVRVKETGEKRKSEEAHEPGKNGRGKRRRGGQGKNLRPGERYVPPPQKRNPGVSFSEDHFQETTYYFERGLRKVRPYYFDFKTYCKGRWIGKTLLEVFGSEFRAESIDYYKQAASAGRIRLNETPIEDLNITLKNNDFLRNTVHRHEPPVSGRALEILENNGEVLVVDKPASLPVHPCGRFRHNTVIFILGKEFGVSGLHTVHRLDRLTSGVLLFARTLEVSKKLDQLVRDRQVEKEYVCRVSGEFPDGELVCEEPILVVSFKVGVCRVDPKGKPCRTVFQRLSWNGHSSVVRCQPLTGRTHQIRVHLQFLGYPILNDPIYGSAAWGPQRAKGGLVGMSDEELLTALVEEHRSKENLHLLDLPDEALCLGKSAERDVDKDLGLKDGSSAGLSSQSRSCGLRGGSEEEVNLKLSQTCSLELEIQENAESGESDRRTLPKCESNGKVSSAEQLMQASPKQCAKILGLVEEHGDTSSVEFSHTSVVTGPLGYVKDALCSECRIERSDPSEKELVMYLHALRYKGPDFEYSTRIPDWAEEDWVEN